MDLVLEWLETSYTNLAEMLPQVSLPAVAIIVLVVSLWLGAACWASSIAEARGRSPLRHLLIGLVVPFVYPLVLRAAVHRGPGPTPAAAAAADAAPVAQPQPAPVQAAAPPDAAGGPVPGPAVAGPVAALDRDYFRRAMVDDQGNRTTGPWRIRYEGRELLVENIVDALAGCVVVEVVAEAGKGPQRLRIPYGKIESCSKA